MSQQNLLKRIELLINEINTLSGIVENNIRDQEELNNVNNELLRDNQQKDLELAQADAKIRELLKNNIQNNIGRVQEDRQHINKILQERPDMTGPQNPLYQLCQEKIHMEQQLRTHINDLEKQNAILSAENTRLRSFIQHDRMFQQMEYLSGKTNLQPPPPLQPQPQLITPMLKQPYDTLPRQPSPQQLRIPDLSNYPKPYLNNYLDQSREPKENLPPTLQLSTTAHIPETVVERPEVVEKPRGTRSPQKTKGDKGVNQQQRQSLSRDRLKK